uniref:Uncharacterized protein n=1 Tax=Magallana gigas TaxID=29159 RepID=K1P7Y2_MAGGI
MLMDRKQVGYFKNKRLEEISLEETRKKKKVSFTRRKWTVAEEEEIKKRFAGFLARDKCPGQKDVEKVRTQSKKYGGLLHARPRDNIKKKNNTTKTWLKVIQGNTLT